MEHNLRHHIKTEELAIRILENLNDLYLSKLLDSVIYRKKSEYINVIRSINHADRIITNDLALQGLVVVYVPANTNNILFSENYRYIGDIKSNITSQTSLISQDRAYFLGKDRFLDILAITDRYMDVYNEYPAITSSKSSGRIKIIPEASFREADNSNSELTEYFNAFDEDIEGYGFFDPDNQRIVLNNKFQTASFLMFDARFMPGIMNLTDLTDSDKSNKDWEAYTVKAPHWAFETMIYEALEWLIPITAPKALEFVHAQKNDKEAKMLSGKPGQSSIIMPDFNL